VLLDSELQPKPTLPVKARNLYVIPISQPVIDRVEEQKLEWSNDAEIIIYGKNLRAAGTKVVFDDSPSVELDPNNPNDRDDRISVRLPINLLSGIRNVRAIRELLLGSPPTEHGAGFESNTVPFVLCPKITSLLPRTLRRGEVLSIGFEPNANPSQSISIIVGNRIIPWSSSRDNNNNNINRITLTIPTDFPIGQALIRIRIDGAESFLLRDERKILDNGNSNPSYLKYIGPSVDVTG
jgi:hypothetical protein